MPINPTKLNHLKFDFCGPTTWSIEDLGIMPMKEYFPLFRVPKLKSHYPMQFSIIYRSLIGGVLLFCRDSIGLFYNLSKLDPG